MRNQSYFLNLIVTGLLFCFSDASSVKFAPSAFLDQGTYTDNEETAEDIDKYTKIINGEEENDLFNVINLYFSYNPCQIGSIKEHSLINIEYPILLTFLQRLLYMIIPRENEGI